jgi:hypothetical protein
MAAFQFYLQSGKRRKVVWVGTTVILFLVKNSQGWVGDDSHVVSGEKFPGERGSVRWRDVMEQPVLLSPKFRVKSSHISTQSPRNVTAVCGIDCSAYQDDFLVNNHPLDVKENDEFALGLTRLFGLSKFVLSVYGSRFLPRTLV